MKLTLALASLLFLASTAVADVSIADNGKKATIDCGKDPVVNVAGNDADLTLTGACTSVSVMGNSCKLVIESSAKVAVPGNNNTVTVAAVDTLAVPGNGNTVSYKGPVTKGHKVKVSKPGTGNTVSVAK